MTHGFAEFVKQCCAMLCNNAALLICMHIVQIRSYVFDVVRGTVPKINLDDVFTVCLHTLQSI